MGNAALLQYGGVRFRDRVRAVGLLEQYQTRAKAFTALGIDAVSAVRQAMGEMLPLIEERERREETSRKSQEELTELRQAERCSHKSKMDGEEKEREVLKRSFLDIDRAAAKKKCSPAQAVAWAIGNLIKGKRLKEINPREWKELKSSCPSPAAAAYLEVFATTNVDTKAIEAALKKEDDAEDKEKTAMRRDGKRMVAMCEDTITRLKKTMVA